MAGSSDGYGPVATVEKDSSAVQSMPRSSSNRHVRLRIDIWVQMARSVASVWPCGTTSIPWTSKADPY